MIGRTPYGMPQICTPEELIKMKDKIIEEIWEIKESVSNDSPGDFKILIDAIKKEAASIKTKQSEVTFQKKKSA